MKGRCPRPLDDRVFEGEAEYGRKARPRKKKKARSSASSPENDRRGAANRSLVLRHRFGGSGDQGRGGGRISEQIRNRRNKGIGRMKLDYSPGVTEFIHDVLKVFHVRTHDHRLAGQDRLNRILAAHSIKAFADDDHCRRGIPVPEFSGGIDQQNGWVMIGNLVRNVE